ncbi:RNA polymerase sigma factor [Streptomyces sp. bgisy100]|uniref:RNA polymerase sigma factor n=1 Tax=Streptomyces sp. bgisy100 TaxID=3413783 RepID=UPI003D74175B
MSRDDLFAAAYREHYWAVSRYVARRLDGQAWEVDEVVAEVFSVAWRRHAEAPEAMLPWLYGVARNCLANAVRGRSRYRRLLQRLSHHEATRGPRVMSGPDAEQPGAWVREALAALPEADQEVLRLTTWEELTLEEAGLALGCSTTAAGMRLHRARQRLRTVIATLDTTTPRGERTADEAAGEAADATAVAAGTRKRR